MILQWELIPDNIDILITHGPPLGVLDHTNNHVRVGCADLLYEVRHRIRPRVHLFGHIHGTSTNTTRTLLSCTVQSSTARPATATPPL